MIQVVINKIKVLSIVIIAVFTASELICGSVPVIQNEVLMTGVVSEYAILSSRLIGIEPDQTLYKLTVYIESSKGIGNSPDFLKDREKQDIQFYTKHALSAELFGKEIKAKVEFQGNQKGGIFWIIGIQ